jgi:hypothetical protein
MPAELIILFGLLFAGLFPLLRYFKSPSARILLVLLGACGAAAGWYRQRDLQEREKHLAALREKSPQEGRPGGYAGSASCRSCHPGEFDSWHGSFHRTMTQYPGSGNVLGDFNNVSLKFDGDTYQLYRTNGEPWVEMVDPDWKYAETLKRARREGSPAKPQAPSANPPRIRTRITLMTGSHHMQTYWVPSRFGNLQFNLPFTYLLESKQWATRHDVFLLNPDKHYTMQLWNTVCLNCHATAGQPRQDPATKELNSQAAEMGISCEACHGPGGEHIQANLAPARRYKLHRSIQGDATIFNPARADHVRASESCGQCHAIRRKLEPQTWAQEGIRFKPGQDLEQAAPLVHYEDPGLPGTPEAKRNVMEGSFWSDKQVRVSGRDFNGLAESPCYQRGQLSCLSCHSMHSYQRPAHQLAPGKESNAACITCHSGFEGKLSAHTHHPQNSSGSLCYNCHMPYTSYGLLKAIRSHTISSPDVQATLKSGRPNACNLCHLDRSLAWTASRLQEWYSQASPVLSEEQTKISSAALHLLTGDAGQRAVVAWHTGWSPAQAASGTDWLAPYLAQLLVDPYSVVRYIAQRSLRTLPGHAGLEYDFISAPAAREAARRNVKTIWEGQKAAERPTALVRPNGALDEAEFSRLLQRRNDRPMELLE